MPHLDALIPILLTIPAADVREPARPMAIALQEAHDLHAVLEQDDTSSSLLAVGFDPARITDLPIATDAAREAQSRWVVVRDRSKPEAQRERETDGIALRQELVAACRWNLRYDARAQSVLDAIVDGEGVADLVQDLLDLAMLITRHLPHFDADQSIDAPAQAESARSLASEIAEGLSQGRADDTQRDAKLLRDRAHTHLAMIVTDIRRAGRYAFRDDPRQVAAFTSDYLHRRRAIARRRAATTDAATTTKALTG